MSRISKHDARRARGGFTLVEVLVTTGLLAIVIAGVFAAYLFVARNLTRLVSVQQQQVESRRTLRTFTQDVSAASQITTASSTQIVVVKPASSGTTTVAYAYSSASQTLVRTEGAASRTMLTGLTSFTLTYYSEAGSVVSSSPQSVKSVEMMFTTNSGTATSGTAASYKTVSPRVVLRNKTTLQ